MGVAGSGILWIIALGVGVLVLIEFLAIGFRIANMSKRLRKMDERAGLQTRYLIAMSKNLACLLQRNLPPGAPMPDDGTEETAAESLARRRATGDDRGPVEGQKANERRKEATQKMFFAKAKLGND